MIVEVCGLDCDWKKEDKGFMSANQTTYFTASGRGLCLSALQGEETQIFSILSVCVWMLFVWVVWLT